MKIRNCPHCGAALNSRVTCQSCGAILPIEEAAFELKRSGAAMLLRIFRHLGEENRYLWGLALTPLVVVPPVLALWKVWDSKKAGRPVVDETFVLLVSLLNIVLSLLIWRWVAHWLAGGISGLLQPSSPPSPVPILKI